MEKKKDGSMTCNTCGVTFSSVEAFNAHLPSCLESEINKSPMIKEMKKYSDEQNLKLYREEQKRMRRLQERKEKKLFGWLGGNKKQ